MLALRRELDVANQHEIIIAGGFAESAVEHLGRALMIALVQFVIGFDDAARRIDQALAGRILADIIEQGIDRGLRLGARRPGAISPHSRGQELGRVELRSSGVGLGRLGLRLVRAQCLDQSVHLISVRPAGDPTGVSPAERHLEGVTCRGVTRRLGACRAGRLWMWLEFLPIVSI